MRIGELSKKYGGVDKRTIDFYTNKGLLVGRQSPTSKYRDYDEDDVERLGKILIFREMGLSIEQIQLVIDDASYWTPQRLGEHIARLKQNQQRENERYEHMIRFAEAMKETEMIPLRFFQLSDMPIDVYTKYLVTSLKKFKENPEAQSEDIAQLEDMIDSFYSNMALRRDAGFRSHEVQGIISRFSNRMQSNFGVIMNLTIQSLIESGALQSLVKAEEKNDDSLDEDVFNMLYRMFEEPFSIYADWCITARSKAKISDTDAMKQHYAERLQKFSEEYDDEDDPTPIIEDALELLSSMCKAIDDPVLLQKFIGAVTIAYESILEKQSPGLCSFITDAIDYYVEQKALQAQ